MRRCAFLTMESLEGYVSEADEVAYAPLRALGWEVEAVPWRRPGVDWRGFDAVVIRTTWDYHEDPQAFVAMLAQVKRSGTLLQNAFDLVLWNMNKTYLRDLERRGVPIVPTAWGSDIGPVDEKAILQRLGTDDVVLKPLIGASAYHTYRLHPGSATWTEAAAAFAHRGYLAQPFISSVVEQGEYSLFFFGGEFSHAVLKTPQSQDFRVQEEHGGIVSAAAASRDLVSAGERVMAAVGQVPLYARVDLVQLANGEHALMELELVEPALYLRMDKGAPDRFANAIDRYFRPKPDGRV
jgi:glutathione synthase/RimK-type ligase-like ATP-grasp enzyme